MNDEYFQKGFWAFPRSWTSLGMIVWTLIGVTLMMTIDAGAVETIEDLVAAREDFINQVRIHGKYEAGAASSLEKKIEATVAATDGEIRARALFELATIQRLTNRFDEAIATYQRVVKAAQDLSLNGLAFDAWSAIARSYAYGTHNHGAAASAFGQAVATAGENPTPKQGYEIANYAAQIQAERGELEAALVNAIEAVRLARSDSELFYAQLDAGSVLQKFAESCDYRKLIDAKTTSDAGDSWGACRRSVGAAKAYYQKARETAKRLGWNFLVNQTEGFISQLDPRLLLIEHKASFEKFSNAQVFTAQDVRNVLVNENFAAGASGLSGSMPLGDMIGEVASKSQSLDPRSLYLLGVRADIEGEPKTALAYFERAVNLLQQERSNLFDFRRRGTVIENRPEIVRDLALRLLAFKRMDEAFLAFESIRARGLSELAGAYVKNNFKEDERRWLAEVVQAESQESALLIDLVETSIAGVEHSKSVEIIEHLTQTRKRHRELLQQPAFQETVKKLVAAVHLPPTISETQELVRKTNIPVVMYWVTHTNVIVWVISPNGVEVKTVFLPEVAVIDKVAKLVGSITTSSRPFDENLPGSCIPIS